MENKDCQGYGIGLHPRRKESPIAETLQPTADEIKAHIEQRRIDKMSIEDINRELAMAAAKDKAERKYNNNY